MRVKPRFSLVAASLLASLLALAVFVPQGAAQREVVLFEPDEARSELRRATARSKRATERAERFEREAGEATEKALRAARIAASVAAQIQRAEAEITVATARLSLARAERSALSARLAQRREPLVRLTAALQASARRPLALSALQPGSLRDLVHVRAVLGSAAPEIRARTAALRSELELGRALERRAARALESLRANERDLLARREELARIEARQRMASREAQRVAQREAERALALAEEARDIDGLMESIDAAAALRSRLAALPGPLPRPANLAATDHSASTQAIEPGPAPKATTAAARPPRDFQLPVEGRTLAGFGERRESGLRRTGIALVPVSGAQVVAPASGRVAFAGPYRGFGEVVIIEHPGGWTSLVTGLARAGVRVGQEVVGGSPLGAAQTREPVITLELRRDGVPVNPVQYLG